MIAGSLLDHSSDTHKIEALYKALRLIGEIDVKPVRGESWFDDLYDADYGPEYEIQSDESWMDDLDEAA
jgi:hypothetical protein